MVDEFDVVIVGAGPAGLAAGIVLARNELRVLICSGRPLPIDKACGEGVLPTGRELLDRLGVLDRLEPDQTHPFRGIRFQTRSGVVAAAPFAEGPGLGVRRTNLSRALVETARRWSHLQIDGSPARSIAVEPDDVRIVLHRRTVRARLVIGADGLNSQVRRWANLEGKPGRLRRFGLRKHFCLPPWSEHVEVTYGKNVEAYVTPCGRTLVGVAFLWHADRRAGPPDFDSLLAEFSDLADRLQGIEPAGPAMGTGPMQRLTRGRTADGVLLVGDAGGYLDACTGEGISLALAQALALEQHLAPWLRRGSGLVHRQDLASCERAFRAIVRPHKIATHLFLYLHRHPRLFDRVLSVAAEQSDLLQWMFSMQMGTVPLWPGWSRVARLMQAFA